MVEGYQGVGFGNIGEFVQYDWCFVWFEIVVEDFVCNYLVYVDIGLVQLQVFYVCCGQVLFGQVVEDYFDDYWVDFFEDFVIFLYEIVVFEFWFGVF